MVTISKLFLKEFIAIFQSQPSLWKSTSDIYKNKAEKLKSLNILLEKYREVDKDANIDTVKKKVNNLKSSYRREQVKVKSSAKLGSGTDKIYIPSLWYYNLLDFLRDEEEQAEGFCTLEGSELNATTPKRKRCSNIEENFLKQATGFLENESNKVRDDAQIFADSWAAMYRNMNEMQQLYAKRIIEDVLMQGRLNKLTPKSAVSHGVVVEAERVCTWHK